MRLDTSPMGSERELIVVPADLRKSLFSVAHSLPYAGHLGVKKTTAKLVNHFYWPNVGRDVTDNVTNVRWEIVQREQKPR